MQVKAEDLAYDRWPEILTARGLSESYFTGRHTPCPMCPDSKDSFRFERRKGGGLYVCNRCTGGKYASPFKLLMQHMGYASFQEAANDVRDFFGQNAVQAVARPMRTNQPFGMSEDEKFRNLDKMLDLWNSARPVQDGDPVTRYMQHRVPGLDRELFELRFHPALEYWSPPQVLGGRPTLLGKYPGMLAKAVDAQGNLVQIHRTFLTADGMKADVPEAKKTMSGLGCNAFAVRLMPVHGDTLAVCEGLETAWAACMLYPEVPVWSCLNGGTMARFELPEELRGQVKRLLIYADSDVAKRRGEKMVKAGSQYAAELADSARRQGLRSMIMRPSKAGTDFADQWLAKCSVCTV